jgi:predicted amidophosphoribosyltransferase
MEALMYMILGAACVILWSLIISIIADWQNTKKCSECGKRNSYYARRCERCGAELGGKA